MRPDHRDRGREGTGGAGHRERGAGCPLLVDDDDPVRGGRGLGVCGDGRSAHRDDRDLGTVDDDRPRGGIEADDAALGTIGAEQRQLRLEVLVHVGVVVEVVVAQVGEAGDVEPDAVDAVA